VFVVLLNVWIRAGLAWFAISLALNLLHRVHWRSGSAAHWLRRS
jgi:hypothetical protein